MVEFKQDERDGIPKLMEINGRFWDSLQPPFDAGVDFPTYWSEWLRAKRLSRSVQDA
jgi:predicted ATP-grasp superfamily ATP-dependent carboligase